MTRSRNLSSSVLTLLAMLAVCSPALAFDVAHKLDFADPLIDLPMYQDPPVTEQPYVTVFNPRLVELWKQALARPDADTRRRTADAIAEAHKEGMLDLREEFGPLLIQQVSQPDQHRLVRFSAAKALVTLDAKEAAEALLERSVQDSTEMALLVDPALAKWDYKPARRVWMERLRDADAPRMLRLMSVQALGQVKEKAAVSHLRKLVMDDLEEPAMRLAAAEALGRIVTKGNEELVKQLIGGSLVDQLAAVALLQHTDTPQARQQLQQLASPKRNATVIRKAGDRLYAIDPALLHDVAPKLASHDDAGVRELAIRAMATDPTASNVTVLAKLLDDVHPEVRRQARDVLIDYGKEHGLRDQANAAAHEVVTSSDSWRGLEQASLVLGKLDHEPSADALINLLDHDRPEVPVAAAAALRWIALPATYDQLLKHAEQLTEKSVNLSQELLAQPAASADVEEEEAARRDAIRANINRQRKIVDHVTAQIFQLFGRQGYTPAEPLMMRYVPKKVSGDIRYGVEPRTAAVWALGLFHEGESGHPLVGQFQSRMTDLNPMDPEADEVRRLSAVGLGRMKARGALGRLNSIIEKEGRGGLAGDGAAWAIAQILDQPFTPPKTLPQEMTGWFLEPLERMDEQALEAQVQRQVEAGNAK